MNDPRPARAAEATRTGLGAAINWKATEKVDTSLFAEYSRLLGPVADSSLVRERGTKNQVLIGVSATYRFDFRID